VIRREYGAREQLYKEHIIWFWGKGKPVKGEKWKKKDSSK
jgi:hypothetical protein